MLFYRGGTHVNRGHYWTPSDGSWIDGRREHRLPGGRDTVYLRLHPIGMFVCAPVIGLVFFLTLPAITVVFATAGVLIQIARPFAQAVSSLAYFEWRPNEAYLAGTSRHHAGHTNGPQESH